MDKKYLMILLGFILSVALFVIIGVLGLVKFGPTPLVPKEYVTEFVLILPGPLITDILLLYAIPVVIYCLYYLFAPYFIVVYIKVHKFIYWIMRRPSQYGIFRLGTTVKPGRLFFRTFVVSLFSFSISALIVQMGGGGLFRAGYHEDFIYHQAEAVFLGTFLICSFMIIIFFPIWLLEDSGVVSYRVFHAERMPVDIQGVHSLYYSILKGYAGFAAILSLATYIIKTFQKLALTDPAILTPIILIALPFIVTGLLAIPIVLYEHFLSRNRDRLYSKLAGFKFPEIMVPKFEEMKLEK
jgi:hypothetical protein